MITVFGGTYGTSLRRLAMLQKRAIRHVTASPHLAHTKPLFEKMKALPLKSIYALNTTLLSIPDFAALSRPDHQYSTRLRDDGSLSLTHLRKTSSRKTATPNAIKLYNNLPDTVRNYVNNYLVCNHNQIKKILKEYYSSIELTTIDSILN